MRLLLIFNPQAGHGRARRQRDEIIEALAAFASVQVHDTRRPGDAADFLAAADLVEFDGIISAGGDGTLFETVNGLYRNPCERRPAMGVLPLGTGNAFARDIGLLPGQWQQALELIRAGRRRRIDVGRVDCPDGVFHFLNIIGAGLPVDAMRIAGPLKVLGNAAYTLGVLWQVLRLKSTQTKIKIDSRKTSEDIVFIEIANTRYTGTSFLIAPGAVFDDGQFDVITLRKLSRFRLLRLFPTIYEGTHVDLPEVDVRQAANIEIQSPSGQLLAPDGELLGRTPAVISCLHRDLEIFA